MVRLREMLLVITVLATPVAWGQEGGSIAHAQKNFDAESSEPRPNKLPELQGLTLASRQASPVQGLKQNRLAELFEDMKVSALQEQTSTSGRFSAMLKSDPVSVSAGEAPNVLQMKDFSGLGPIGSDARLMASVRNSDSRWKVLLRSDLDKK